MRFLLGFSLGFITACAYKKMHDDAEKAVIETISNQYSKFLYDNRDRINYVLKGN